MIPVLLPPDELVDYLAASEESHTLDELQRALLGPGRNALPGVVFELSELLLLPLGWWAPLVADAWCGCEFPGLALDPDEWLTLWDLAGFTVDEQRAPRRRPRRPRRLYRGAHPDHAAGMSWTPDLALARWFADRNRTFGFPASVYTAEVEPARVLAIFTGTGGTGRTGEAEWVVDTAGLAITPWPAS